MSVTANDDRGQNAQIGAKTRKGFALLTLRSVISRILAPLGQIFLARLLMPEDYGVIGLAYTVTSLAAVLQTAGVKEILVRRHKQFRRWRNAAFWLALLLGLVSSAIILLGAPAAAAFYGNGRLAGVLAGLSLLPVLNALTVVPQAELQARMEFRGVFRIEMFSVIGWPVSTVLCAWLGLGPYSFVIPQVLIAATSVWMYWRVSGLPRPHKDWHIRRWRFLASDVFVLLGSGGLLTIAGQVDRMILGRMASSYTVGVYYFAFAFAVQTIQLFSGSVVQVLMPALAGLQDDPVRQRSAFERATVIVAYVAVPLCLLQAALAEPVVRLLFGVKWVAAVPVVEILCLGTAFDIVSASSHAAIRAQGRFKIVLAHALVSLAVFGTAGVVLTHYYGVVGMAWAFVVNFSVCTVFLTWQVYRPWGGGLRDALRLYLGPQLLCLLAGIPWAITALGLTKLGLPWVHASMGAALVGTAAYAMLLRWRRPDVWAEVIMRGRQTVQKVPWLRGLVNQVHTV